MKVYTHQDEEFVFQIVTRYDKVIFACHNQDDLDNWMNQLKS